MAGYVMRKLATSRIKDVSNVLMYVQDLVIASTWAVYDLYNVAYAPGHFVSPYRVQQ